MLNSCVKIHPVPNVVIVWRPPCCVWHFDCRNWTKNGQNIFPTGKCRMSMSICFHLKIVILKIFTYMHDHFNYISSLLPNNIISGYLSASVGTGLYVYILVAGFCCFVRANGHYSCTKANMAQILQHKAPRVLQLCPPLAFCQLALTGNWYLFIHLR